MSPSTKAFLIIASLVSLLVFSVWGLGDALGPLMFSFGLAYLVFPLVKKLEAKGVHRNFAVVGIFGLILCLAAFSFLVVVPALVSDARDLANDFPKFVAQTAEKVESVSGRFGYRINLSKESLSEYLEEHTAEVSGGLIKGATKSIKSAYTGVTKVLLAILNIFLVPLFFFYVINDYEKISKEIKSYIPKSIRPKFSHYLRLANTVLSGYIRGQLLVALILGLLYAFGLFAIGLKFGFLIGLLSGLISIIPYAGFTLGFLIAILVALANFSGIGLIVGVVAVFVIVQALEGAIITPKLVGDKVGLSSLATMLALIIGGNLFGLVGIIAAIPIAAILKSLLIDLRREYHQLEFFEGN